jgi:hypothetical protein
MSIKPFPAYAVETAQLGAAADAVTRAAERRVRRSSQDLLLF